MPKGVYEKTPEHCAALSTAKKGVPLSPKHCAALKGVPKPPRTPEQCNAISIRMENSDANKAQIESMRGGGDICGHHYIYDESDLSKNTVQMTRSNHQKLHRLLQKLGYIVPHINIKEI